VCRGGYVHLPELSSISYRKWDITMIPLSHSSELSVTSLRFFCGILRIILMNGFGAIFRPALLLLKTAWDFFPKSPRFLARQKSRRFWTTNPYVFFFQKREEFSAKLTFRCFESPGTHGIPGIAFGCSTPKGHL